MNQHATNNKPHKHVNDILMNRFVIKSAVINKAGYFLAALLSGTILHLCQTRMLQSTRWNLQKTTYILHPLSGLPKRISGILQAHQIHDTNRIEQTLHSQ